MTATPGVTLSALNRRAWLGGSAGTLLTACAPPGGKGLGRSLRIGYQRYGLLLVAKARGAVDHLLQRNGHGHPEWIEPPRVCRRLQLPSRMEP